MSSGLRKVILSMSVVIIALIGGWFTFSFLAENGHLGSERDRGIIQGAAIPDDIVLARQTAESSVAPTPDRKQIMFGDLHVHTTYSTDAFLWSLPLYQGKGLHPLADACDYARYCSALDFWAITDHAEASIPERWENAKQSIRECQAKSNDQSNPDMVSMIGFEWTQVGITPETHYGHKNVIFKGLDDKDVPVRTIAAAGITSLALRNNAKGMPAIVSLMEFQDRQIYWDFNTFFNNIQDVPECDTNTPSNELPANCYETAVTPGDLIRKLRDEQNLDPLIIPHGTSWGLYTPHNTTWDKQLTPANRPEEYSLIEIFSGHGNSEEYRDFETLIIDDDGKAICPPATEDYTPSCFRMGEIVEERCLAEGTSSEECTLRAFEAREIAAFMGPSYHLAIGGDSAADWLLSGQCTDCYLPAFHHRPLTSVQAGLALSRFDEDADNPTRFNWGFISSSDNHRARPGTGYKEFGRRLNTEAAGPKSAEWLERLQPEMTPVDAYVHPLDPNELAENANLGLAEVERQSSFWLTGGLAAVHTEGRSREEVWDAMQRRETYGTSGPRMLMWFDRVAEDGTETPMGSSVSTTSSGTFKVKAVGSFKQKPGCPDHAIAALGVERLNDICGGECYNPSDERNLIERIEIVRIRPQTSPDEKLEDLIEDPFIVHNCPADQNGCSFTFTDPDFKAGERDTLYYARAIQEPWPTINAEPIKCEYDEEGNCVKANVCTGDYRSGDDECLTMKDVRAWSSPIYLNYGASSSTVSSK